MYGAGSRGGEGGGDLRSEGVAGSGDPTTTKEEQIVKLHVLVQIGTGMIERVVWNAAVTFIKRIRKYSQILVPIAVLLLAICLCWQLLCERSRVAKLELIIYFDSVELGVRKEEAVNAFCEAGFQRIWIDASEERILVRSPLEIGAHNWIGIICLDKNELIAAKLVRIHDSTHRKPAASPEDEMMSDYSLPSKFAIESIFVEM